MTDTETDVGRIPGNRRFTPQALKALLTELRTTNRPLSPELQKELVEELAAQRLRTNAAWDHANKVKKRAAEAKRLADEEEKLAAEAERRAQLAEDRAARTTKQAQEYVLRLSGEYYAPMERVWKIGKARYGDEALFEALRREKTPAVTERPGWTSSSYAVTLAKATSLGGRPAVDHISADTVPAWPTTVFGEQESCSQIAHLVPLCYERASMYSDVARCVLGLQDDARINIQQAIHGTQPIIGRTRIPDTGIKYCQGNQICLTGQEFFFNKNPCVVIVPIMKLEQLKAWNIGEGFEAIVLAGATGMITAAEAYRGIQMFEPGSAEPDEIETARQLLEQVVRGLAYSLVHRRRQRREKSLKPAMRQLLQSFREQLLNSSPEGEVVVPLAWDEGEGERGLCVGKVSFKYYARRAHRDYAHPPPDPMFLAMKAAINWSWCNGQQLLVTGEPTEDEDDEEDEEDMY
jgi:hypothetical protein